MKITVLSGGVGGARFLRGVMAVVDPDNVSIIGNVGDDIEVLDLHVSPDLDSVLYALAGVADEERGWGRADETWNALATASELGGDAWFRLGDRDIGLHLVRTQLLREGAALSEATARLARAFGLRCALLPATDDPLRTFIETAAGTFAFQTWFVARGHRDEVDAVHYTGAPDATPGARRDRGDRGGRGDRDRAEQPVCVDRADPGCRGDPRRPRAPAGPVHRRQPARRRSCRQGARRQDAREACRRHLTGDVAACYPGLIDVLVIDESDAPAELPAGVRPVVAKTLMTDDDARRRLALAVLEAAGAVA